MDAQLKKGLIEFCILTELERDDSYGYQIIKDLFEYVKLSESTLYSVLRRMEECGNVEAYTKEYNGRLRKYFRLSEKGKGVLNAFRKDSVELIRILEFIGEGVT